VPCYLTCSDKADPVSHVLQFHQVHLIQAKVGGFKLVDK
jgi:hypothetical protein